MKNLILALLISLIPITTFARSADVSPTQAANALAVNGIIVNNATNPSAYNLEGNILRQEMAGVVAKIAKIPNKDNCDGSFKDVKITPQNDWACARIESLLDAGVIAANEYYRPTAHVSQAEALSFILKGLYEEEYNAYKMLDKSPRWEMTAVKFAKSKNILRQDITEYTANATRGFIFQIMHYAYQDKYVVTETADSDETNNSDFDNIDLNTENLERQAEINARSWLTDNQGKYTNISELAQGIAQKYGSSSLEAKKAVELVSSGEFSYQFKKVVVDTTNGSGSDTQPTTNKKYDNIYGNNVTAEDIAKGQDLIYWGGVVGSVEDLKAYGVSLERAIQRWEKKNVPQKKIDDMIHYWNTGETSEEY